MTDESTPPKPPPGDPDPAAPGATGPGATTPPPPTGSAGAGAGAPPPPPPGGGGPAGGTGPGSTGGGAPPPPPGTGGTGGASDNRQIMLVLSYLWILALIPYLTEQRDPEVKWHARHGLVLMVAEIVLNILLFVLSLIPVVGCVISVVWMLAWIGIVVLHVVCLVKALGGERFTIPYVSQYVDQVP